MEKFSYANRNNLEYIEAQYQEYLQNPAQTDPQWRLFFEGIEFAQNISSGGGLSDQDLQVHKLINAYRFHGHLEAQLDPLELSSNASSSLDPKTYGFTEEDMAKTFDAGSIIGLSNATLKEILEKLRQSYCGTMSCHVGGCDNQVHDWFHKEFEGNHPDFNLSDEDKKEILRSLIRTESLEKFIHTRYVGTKRFSIEGGDALIPMLETLVKSGVKKNVEEIVIGMAHRGRINVLANFMGKATEIIFADFDGTIVDNTGYYGDVKYHLGYSSDKNTPDGSCHISLAFNPSHLEAVNPVAMGMARAKQRVRKDSEHRQKVVPIIIHGDAAFSGQGVVSESLQLSKLPGYTVGGSIHIIINNQIGFTTNPEDSRSTRYSSDISKSVRAPVILVNGDDPEACARAMDMAVRFRQGFGQDVIIDMICYRRFGHNEGDEPAFTQPQMYAKIKKHPTLMTLYRDQLAAQGVLDKSWAEDLYKEKIDNLQKELDEVRKAPPELKQNAFSGLWKNLRRGTMKDFGEIVNTQSELSELKALGEALVTEPENFKVHSKIKRLLGMRKKMIEEDKLDWGLTELLAYASLVKEGTSVRLSGQDVKRGTFTHRHAVYFDSETGDEYCPLKNINPDKEFCVYNSLLSEMAVLGFEYGNSISDPTFLTIWEAQFGDFANGAQIIIDQFITSGEEKWARGCGLVLLLPHGYEGQGPEHSSARLERFLQLAAGDSIQVCNLTTPANLFHVLRRQIKRDFRKPLVIMSPKSLLRHPKVVSTMNDLATGQFEEVFPDPKITDLAKIQKLILCTGKIYYDLDKHRDDNQVDQSIAIVRTEQISPFPKVQLTPIINSLPNLQEVVWTQEEPQNMGAYTFMKPKIENLLTELGIRKVPVNYAGRIERSSPATGSPKVHAKEQQSIIDTVFKN